ncbi:Transcriptional regulator PadR-like family protein [Halogranum amylolyticum]|uniref:Transcriptional regulator PadR-like family protein n=1 Tax=Halogranum amylolyticum TaxID=660520 RepID=A0A1H8U5P3_9EURY|nr:helix-turn-helix transcriptional regulator [Halogranum amylolyticum]SEO98376.1 Transcriptional regulator PadR-like family protein [Halogranum amylolyticum]
MSEVFFNLTGFQRDLLYVIANLEKPSGQAVKEAYENSVENEISDARLYPNLDTLVNEGLLQKGDLDRRTNYYTITDEGLRALETRRTWENGLVAQFH